MTLTLLRLAFAGMRFRVLPSVLTIILTAGAAATIVLALEVRATGSDPWTKTFEAAHGAHVLGNLTTREEARTLAGLSGVNESAAPVPITRATMLVDGRPTTVLVAGLEERPRVNLPVLTQGSGVARGGALLERSLARALGIEPGTRLQFSASAGPVELAVTGTAISPAQARYPRSNPGLVWVSRADLERIQPDADAWRWQQAVRLADPESAPLFAAAAAGRFPPGTVSFQPWQSQRDLILTEAQPVQLVLTLYTLLLLLVSVAVTAILTGARLSSQYREIGLLKAIGLTPVQASLVFVLEAVALGAAGVVLGFIPGALLAPHLVPTVAATLLDSPKVNADVMHMLVAAVVILPVIAVSAFATAYRATSASAMQAIREGNLAPRTPSRLGWLIWRLGWLPVTLALGLKDLLARRTRPLWLMAAIAVTGAAMVVTLCIQATLGDQPPGEPSDVPDGLLALILALDAVLVMISLTALAALAILSVRERIRDFGVLRTVGLTPNEVALSVSGAHAALGLAASLVAIPAGIGLFLALYTIASGEDVSGAAIARWWWLLLVPIAITLATALATTLPARLASRVPVSDAVRYE
jgi:putative ABC transport system permease protein